MESDFKILNGLSKSFFRSEGNKMDEEIAALVRTLYVLRGDTSRENAPKVINGTITESVVNKYESNTVFIIRNVCHTADENGGKGLVRLNVGGTSPEAYLSQFQKCRVYRDEKRKNLFFVTDSPVEKTLLAAILPCIPKLMPWMFPNSVDEKVVNLCKLLAVDNKKYSEQEKHDLLKNFCNDVYDRSGFEKTIKRIMLADAVNFALRNKIKSAEDEISDVAREIAEMRIDLKRLCEKHDELLLIINALSGTKESDCDELIDVLDSHKNLTIEEVTDGDIYYRVVDTLEFYNTESIDRTLSFMPDEIRGIFIDKLGLIRVKAVFELSSVKTVSPVSHDSSFSIHYQGFEDAMPNPHIYGYGCSGGNDYYYEEYAQSGDYDLAIDQSIAATKNINLKDTVVAKYMFNWMASNQDTKCIYIPDGEFGTKVTKPTGRLVSFNEYVECYKKWKEKQNS